MDQYGMIGPNTIPDPSHGSYVEGGDRETVYTLDCDHIAYCLRDGASVRVQHSHRGSVYTLVLIPSSAMIHYTSQAAEDDVRELMFVGVETVGRSRAGFYRFHWSGFISTDYVQEKLGIDNQVDAEAISGFLNRVLGV